MTRGTMAAALAGMLALAGCGEREVVTIRTGSVPAEAACVAAVDRTLGNEGTAIVNSNFSDDGSEVTLRAGDGSDWRCLATNAGEIRSLTAG